ncbi:Polyadenylate-binding protein RBP45B [Histomonas meleagridis]|uniref:Polyadenylate-binding protein RBP45B n=1 Tax=Histomonas meleagridis TaxID=135588 RepID=UPI00355948F4|nr:Polyadenylate-binding protein RBP45B [Histomonas meleagridis]KAH0796648.1 Polyadenylate-binding protein RBP45B [Histomonas meleagridis]
MSSNHQLWVGNTDLWESEEQLMNTVRQKTGVVPVSCRFQRNKLTGALMGYGFLEFNTPSEAATVLRLLRDTPIPQSPTVRFRLNWGKVDSDLETLQQAAGYSIYVGNLPLSIDEEKLLDYFRRYFPDVISSRLIRGTDNISRGFGFVKFNTQREVDEAIRMLNGSSEFGRPIKISEATGNRVHTDSTSIDSTNTTLFLQDIDPEIVTEQILMHFFKPYGNIIRIKFVTGHPDWAYITMESHSEAESARNALQGSRFGGTTKVNIQFGRAMEEPVETKTTTITVPVIKPQKINRKLEAEFFDDAGTKRVFDIMQRYMQQQRQCPIANVNPKIANKLYEKSCQQRELTFELNAYSETMPSSAKLWFF